MYGEDYDPTVKYESDIDSNLSNIALCVGEGGFAGIELSEEDGDNYLLDDFCYGDYIAFDLTGKSLIGFRVIIDTSTNIDYSTICPIV